MIRAIVRSKPGRMPIAPGPKNTVLTNATIMNPRVTTEMATVVQSPTVRKRFDVFVIKLGETRWPHCLTNVDESVGVFKVVFGFRQGPSVEEGKHACPGFPFQATND